MSAWILSIVAAQIACFVVSLFLEGTKYANVASKVCGIFLVFAISFPFLTCQNGTFAPTFPDQNEFELDQSFLQNSNAYKINIIKDEIEKKLESFGLKDAEIVFQTTGGAHQLVVEKVFITLTEQDYLSNKANIHKIKKSIQEVIRIGDESIIIQT